MISHQLADVVRFSLGKVAVHRVRPGVWAVTYAGDPTASPFAGLDPRDFGRALLNPPTEQVRFARTYAGAWAHAEQIARTLPRRWPQ